MNIISLIRILIHTSDNLKMIVLQPENTYTYPDFNQQGCNEFEIHTTYPEQNASNLP